MSKLFLLILFFLLILNINILFAGRPFATEDAGVAGKGVFQTEVSIDYAQDSGINIEYRR